MLNHLNWDLVRIFLSVAQLGSLSKASKELGMSQPTVGRHLKELETQLNAVLVVRSTRGISLSEVGEKLVQSALPVAKGMQDFLFAATDAEGEARGRVRIAATDIVGVLVLMPMLARLQNRFKNIEVELTLDNRSLSLSEGEADIAVRMAKPKNTEVVGHKLGYIPTGLYACHSYLLRHGKPMCFSDLTNFQLIGFESSGSMEGYLNNHVPEFKEAAFSFRSDSLLAQLEAARMGMGIVGLQKEIASRYSELENILPDFSIVEMPLWMVMHKDISRGAHVRAIYDGLRKELSLYLKNRVTPLCGKDIGK